MVENKKKMMLRIADVLNTHDDDDYDDDFIGVQTKNLRRVEGCSSISIRSILSRWISPFKRSRDLSKPQWRSNTEEDCLRGIEGNGSFLLDSSEGNDKDFDDDDDDRSMEKSEESNSHTEIVPTPVSPLGSYMKDVSFSLGVGAGLVYLMVSARNEFRRMTELRSLIEFLEDVSDGVRKKNANGNNPSESNSVLGFSTTASPATITQNCASSHNLVNSKVDVKLGEHLECLESKEECVVGIDELEAEFEAELERLQLSLDNEDSLDHSRQQEQEMVCVNSAPVQSDSSSFGIKDDPGELVTEEQSGVSPHELERRLHELLETRQQERIKELECALEHVKHELHKKEMEVSWWKDTARRFSPHVSEATPLSSATRFAGCLFIMSQSMSLSAKYKFTLTIRLVQMKMVILRYVSYIMDVDTLTADCLILVHDLLLPVIIKDRAKGTLSHQKNHILGEIEEQIEQILARVRELQIIG